MNESNIVLLEGRTAIALHLQPNMLPYLHCTRSKLSPLQSLGAPCTPGVVVVVVVVVVNVAQVMTVWGWICA